ncbi:MAG TPA: hypothetical protein P5050_05955 [Bacteroidia bacterium]|nr:hypothetical protein [Bacteroidia bacterium]HRS58749.1 hypothetical protein [Bacteroidia bacterium]HRU67917.1 hypothetical protein [Bacteroidia bacterium]
MKELRLILMAVFMVFAMNTQAQKNEIKTIFGNKEVAKGGFGSMSIAFQPEMFGRQVYFTGFRGGWIMNHWMSFGLGGYSLTSTVRRDLGWSGSNPRSLSLYMTYGGFYIESTLMPKFPVHVSFPFLLGGGGAIYIDETFFWDPEIGFSYKREDSDMFLVIEPGINLELNFVKNLRFGIGVNYRLVEDLKLYETESNAFNGLSYSFTIKLGKF